MTNVFSGTRETLQPIFNVKGVKLDSKQKMDGLKLLEKLETKVFHLFFLTRSIAQFWTNKIMATRERDDKKTARNFHK